MDANAYGPALPPGFRPNREDTSSLPVRVKKANEDPVRKPCVFGPRIPSELLAEKKEDQTSGKCDLDSKVIGPVPPPGFSSIHTSSDSDSESDSGNQVIGPVLPAGFAVSHERGDSDSETDSDNKVIGPPLPPGFSLSQAKDDSDSDSVHGPMPANECVESVDSVIADIEKRATDMKKKLQGEDKPVNTAAQREQWMTLPATDYKNQFGIISRCLVDDDQAKPSCKRASRIEESHHSSKDEKLKEELEKYNKAKRAKSLLELHKKKKKEKELGKPKERKAFDRDAELGIRLMDQKQVNSVIRNSRKLNSRFAAGASQYL